EFGERADLSAAQDAVRDADTDHEKFSGFAFAIGAAEDACAVALRVNAPGAEVRAKPFGRAGSAAVAGELTDFVEVVSGELLAFEAFDALGLGFLYWCCIWHWPVS